MKIFDFTEPDAAQPWQAIDDRVMGGVSQSEITSVDHNGILQAVFRGNVSLQNNGGFCSVRADLHRRIDPETEHLWIQCHNAQHSSAKTYYLNVRTQSTFDGVSYRTAFTPVAESARFEFTAVEFAPVFRGRAVPDAPELQFSEVRQIGLMIADSQIGHFELFISAIGAS